MCVPEQFDCSFELQGLFVMLTANQLHDGACEANEANETNAR